MSGSDEQSLRISDAEREAAISTLGEHMTAGRLTIDEYGERSAQVTAAKTRGDVLAQFSDLPRPQPSFGEERKAEPAPKQRSAPVRAAKQFPTGIAIAVVALLGFGALMFVSHGGAWFVAIPLIIILSNGAKNNRWQREHRAREHERAARHHERMARRYYDSDE